jgi:hypothetical protein
VFLALGGTLQSIVAQAREIAGLSKQAAGLGTVGESAQSLQTLEQILAAAIEVRALGQLCREQLHRSLVHLERCHTPMDRLLKLPTVLKTVGILSRIEASHVDSDSASVSTLTADMDDMTREIAKHVAAAGGQAATLSQLIKAGTEHLDEVADRERDQTADLIRQTSAVIGSFRARQEAANRAALKIDKQYGEIRLAIDKVVMSLQAEDMARQRIEHVLEALDQITAGVPTMNLHSGDADVLALQRSQLLSTRNFLSGSIASVRDHLQSLAPHLDALTKETSSLASQTDEEGHSFATEVNGKLDALCSIFGPYLNSARTVVSTVDSVLPGLAKMASAVRELEEIQASIRIMALNAKIKTKRLGKHGTVIGALAVELYEIARQSDSDTQEVRESLHAVQGPLQGMGKQKATSSSLSSNMMQWSGAKMKEEMGSLIASVIGDSQELSKLLAVLLEKAAKLRTDLDAAAAAADRGGVVTQTFDGVLKELDRDLRRMGCSPDVALSRDGKTARLSTLYTMQMERRVHEQSLGGGTPALEAAGRTQSAADEIAPDDLGCDVELF